MKTHNNKISKIIKIAQKESLRSPHDKFQLGAVLFHQNKIISKAFNNPHKSHPYIFIKKNGGGEFMQKCQPFSKSNTKTTFKEQQ